MAHDRPAGLRLLPLELVASLPVVPRLSELSGASIDADGGLLVSYQAARDGGVETNEGAARPVTVFRRSGETWLEHTVMSRSRAPLLHPAPDGGLLVVDPNSRRGADGAVELNAAIHRADGALARRFAAGDGIVDVQASGDAIWVSYGDLGTTGDFGLFGWGRLSPDLWIEPVGNDGIVTFGWSGQRLASVVAPPPLRPIVDCFALNVRADDAWCSYFPGFSLLQIRRDGTMSAWAGIGSPVTAIAVREPHVLLGRLVAGEDMRAWVGQLGDDSLTDAEELEPAPAGEPASAIRFLMARGDALHAITGRGWYRARVPAR